MSPIPEVVITAPRKKHKLGGSLTFKNRSSKYSYSSISSKNFVGSRLIPLSRRDNFNINDMRY